MEPEELAREVLGAAYLRLVGSTLPAFRGDSACLRQAFGGATATSDAALEHVVTLPEYRARYGKLVDQYLRLEGKVVSERERQALLEKFARVPDYTPERLMQDIMRSDPEADRTGLTATGLSATGPGPRTAGLEAVGLGEVTPAIPYSTSLEAVGLGAIPDSTGTLARGSRIRFVRRWRQATGQPMDAFEYARYSDHPDMSTEEMAETKRSIDAAASAASDRELAYAGVELPRVDFLDAHVWEFDAPDFEARHLEAVLRSDVYAEMMRARLRGAHFQTFGWNVHKEDLDHCFAIAREERLPLESERVSEILIRMSGELTGIQQRVDAVYTDVLKRNADSDEKRENVARFRSADSKEPEIVLRGELYASLEFRDVVKDQIAAWYRDAHKREIRPKQLFDALRGVIERHGSDMGGWSVNDLRVDPPACN